MRLAKSDPDVRRSRLIGLLGGTRPERKTTMDDMDDCPCCGGLPKMTSERATYGHGDCPTEWSVSCDCGMRTKGIPTGYEGSDAQCKAKAAAIWNRRQK